jgi:hypothetical protein
VCDAEHGPAHEVFNERCLAWDRRGSNSRSTPPDNVDHPTPRLIPFTGSANVSDSPWRMTSASCARSVSWLFGSEQGRCGIEKLFSLPPSLLLRCLIR